jgi:SpoVK/Ycf46/Vps4 family AAA+-type ATPase
MMFSGPPGTGKTLAAEVLAGELGLELLIVDVARVVSKWIGETEKNLADVFDAAERFHGVLLFDEADALFAKRTDATDAHARYANMESAYLLGRLERFEGLVILSTNLRSNVDPAFTRRLEISVVFDEPTVDERRALWRRHIPAAAPLAPDVDVEELAELFPVVGGVIRMAAMAAAFLAGASDGPIRRQHVLRAVRREYEKHGKAFPAIPLASTDAEIA